jgi:hypothetical protein
MRRPIACLAALLSVVVATPAADAKGYPWLLEVEQTSAHVGDTIDVTTVATPPRYSGGDGFGSTTIRAYLVPGELAGRLLKAGTHVVELGTLPSDASYRGQWSLTVPAAAPGRYVLGAHVDESFLIGTDTLIVRRRPGRSTDPFAALALLGAAAAFLLLLRLRRTR